ncbi:MAG TPA: M20/M25/M40 family metallo-hydrolase, partial [Trueperaceae bacterium]|nr:M20/M25/M40 family metallo-hydrolase [Trueperaceae bacterium]
MKTSTDRALAEVDMKAALTQLALFCGQPSVAAQDLGMEKMASLVAGALDQLGAEVEYLPTASHPCLYGRVRGGDGPTLLFYNHYDVQPAEPFEEWSTPPFQLTRRGDLLFARGTADNKGNLVARMAAVAAWQRAEGQPPGDVIFLVEGGEEVGSPDLEAVVANNAERLRCDGVLWESGYQDPEGRPILHLGVKGNLYVELVVDAGRRDLHSSYAPLVPNPAWRLVTALATIRSPSGRVLLPGFYDDVQEPDAADLSLLAAIPFDDIRWRDNFGISDFIDGVKGAEAKRRLYFSPTCNIAGLSSGYGGDGAKTVLPAKARAKIDFRLVPDQEPAK